MDITSRDGDTANVKLDVATLPGAVYEASTPLGENRFRLLQLRPGQQNARSADCEKDDVVADLIMYNLDDPPPYIALSYSWGDQEATASLRIGQQERLHVSAHLDCALRQLRDESHHVLVWIDAICINQSNLSERGDQVKIMKKIFSTAENVYIWMGMAPKSPVCRSTEDGPTSDSLRWMVALNRQTKRDEQFVGIDLECLRSIVQEGEHVWWRRKWVLQEIAVAKHPPLVLYDTHLFDGWAFFHRWPMDILTKPNTPSPVVEVQSTHTRYSEQIWLRWMATEQSIQIPWKLRSWWEYYEIPADGGRPLGELLKLAAASHASQRLDHVYALVGLSSPNHRVSIGVDYTVTLKALFQTVSALLWSTEGNPAQHAVPREHEHSSFDMLAWQWAHYSSPSWVCDFSAPSQLDHADFHSWIYVSEIMRMAGQVDIPIREMLGDTIAIVSSKPSLTDKDLEHIESRWHCHNISISPSTMTTANQFSSFPQSIMDHIILQGIQLGVVTKAVLVRNHFQSDWKTIAAELSCSEERLKRIRLGHSKYIRTGVTPQSLASFNLFILDTGYIGLYYNSTIIDGEHQDVEVHPGAVVALMLGATMPFLLRKCHDGAFSLVGACMLSNDTCVCRKGSTHSMAELEQFTIY